MSIKNRMCGREEPHQTFADNVDASNVAAQLSLRDDLLVLRCRRFSS